MKTFKTHLLLIFCLVVISLLVLGVFFYQYQKKQIREQVVNDLSSIIELKVARLVNWRHERLADAYVLSKTPFLIKGVEHWLSEQDEKDLNELLKRLQLLREHNMYSDIKFIDIDGKVRFELDAKYHFHPEGVEAMKQAIMEKKPVFADLHSSDDSNIHLSIVAPVFSTEDASVPRGAFILTINATDFLFPLLESWPVPCDTAETLLVRKDGDSVLFLNELRHMKNTALKLRIPLTRRDVPAVMAVLGKEGVVDGVDYRGVKVFSVIKAVPESPWFMISKIDQKEALQVWKFISTLILAFIFLSLLSAALATYAYWQRESKSHLLELMNSESRRQLSEDRFKTTLSSIGDGVIATDSKGNVEFMNPIAESLTGWTFSEALGKPLETVFKIINENTRQTIENPALKVIREGQIVGLANHTILVSKDGTERPIADSGAPIRGQNDEILGVVLVFRDQSEERKILERLTQSEKMEAIGILAGGIAHDFNNMLQVIIGHAQLAKRNCPDDKLNNSLSEIEKAAQRSSNLTKQLLGFARKQVISPKVQNLNDIVPGITSMLRRLIGEDIDLAWIPGNELWNVKVDASQIDQILANLAVNARDAISGSGRITIETSNIVLDQAACAEHPEYLPGDYVMIAVSDNGCGMDKDTLSHIFEPFFSTKAVGKGTGLGLATVFGIVKQNNGYINVYSEIRNGSTFKIYLPRTMEEPDVSKSDVEVSEGGSETILLVEDEDSILQFGKMLLEQLGYKVYAEQNPGKAYQFAKECDDKIDLLITDVIMPAMNGRELFERISKERPGIKVLYMSGYTGNVITQSGIIEQDVIFVQKPFTLHEISLKVREALEKK